MTKDFKRFLEKIKKDNKAHKIKIIVRKTSDESIYRISLQRHKINGKKESRGLNISIVDSSASKIDNKNNIKLVYEIRLKLESDMVKDDIDGKSVSIKKKLLGNNFFDYFDKIIEEKRQKNYRICRDHIFNFVKNDELKFKEISPQLVREFTKHLLSEGRTKRTAHNYFKCLKAVFNLALIDGKIHNNPALGIRIRYPKKEKERLTIDQLRKLYKTPCENEQLKNAFLFSCYTGLRKDDIRLFTENNIVNDYITVITSKTKVKIKLKINRTVKILLNSQKVLIKKSIQYCRQRGIKFDESRLFSFPSGGRSSSILRKWFVDSGIITKEEVNSSIYTFHTARHTFISNIVEYSGNIALAQQLVGHQDIKTTQIYTHLSEKTKNEGLDLLPELE